MTNVQISTIKFEDIYKIDLCFQDRTVELNTLEIIEDGDISSVTKNIATLIAVRLYISIHIKSNEHFDSLYETFTDIITILTQKKIFLMSQKQKEKI